MGQCVQMWTRNYGALDETARMCFGVLCANRKKEEDTREKTGKKPGRERKETEKKPGEKRIREKSEEEQKERTRDPERESAKPALNGEKGLSPEIGVKKMMNAGGVEHEYMN
ncbi:hypothetical protein TNCV_2178031 [Trichonephila clavipes]|uniref:Uncharacterized protein n=1 Tax=Trichonephila clavipes TaxID=2585209 RepID=A0A8X6VU96_TRICX|nr:hypothetical protein TNCV_2178031 [Trichonephila clavipes]